MSGLLDTPLKTRFPVGLLVPMTKAKEKADPVLPSLRQQVWKMLRLAAYLSAILGPQLIGGALIVALEWLRPGGDYNSNTTTVLLGMSTAASAQLLSMVNRMFEHKDVKQSLEHLHECQHQLNDKADVAANNSAAAANQAAATEKKTEQATQEIIKKLDARQEEKV